jgi:hypothetical protein
MYRAIITSIESGVGAGVFAGLGLHAAAEGESKPRCSTVILAALA